MDRQVLKLGISQRSSIGLGLIIGAVLLFAILLGAYFLKVFHVLESVRSKEIPHLTSTFLLIRESERIETLTSEIVTAQNNFIRQSLMQELADHKRVWDQLLIDIGEKESDLSIDELTRDLQRLFEGKIHLSNLIRQRTSLSEKNKQSQNRLLVLASRLNDFPLSGEKNQDRVIRFLQVQNSAIALLLTLQDNKVDSLDHFATRFTELNGQANTLLEQLPEQLKGPMRAINREVSIFTRGEYSLFSASKQLDQLRHGIDNSLVENTFISNSISTATDSMLITVQNRMTSGMDTLSYQLNRYSVLLLLLSVGIILLALLILSYLRRSVVKRLSHLGRETLHIANKSNVIQGKRVLVEGEDEITTLAESVNSLLDEIALREEALLSAQRVLEDRVRS